MRTRNPWVVAVAGLLTVVGVVILVLTSATLGVPSEISVPLMLAAIVTFRWFKNRRGHPSSRGV